MPGTGINPGTGMKPGTGMNLGTGMNPGTGIHLFKKINSDSRNLKSMKNCDCSMCKFTHATIQMLYWRP